MGDRRNGDRRAPEKGVIRIPFHDAIIYISFTIIVLVLLVSVIFLAKKNAEYKEAYTTLNSNYEDLKEIVNDYDEFD